MDPALRELIAGGAPDDEVAIIVRLVEGRDPPPPLRIVARFGEIATARAPRRSLAAIHGDPAVASLKAPRVYAGEWTVPVRSENGDEPGLSEADPDPIDSDIRRPVGLPETGRGTVICAIDWGIDFAHPDFCNADGTTRLLALWDQRARGQPQPYGYGRIYAKAAIDRALAQRDPFAALGYSPGHSPSHGSHVLGIAAGNGRAGGPQGIAPEADLIFVHLGPGVGDLGNSIDLLEAIDFATRVAGSRPLSINMSIGRHAGPHDGTLLIERAIDWLIVNRPGILVVQSTGNYFDRGVHMEGRLHETRTAALPFHLPESDEHPVTVEIWYKGADTFSARAFGPSGADAVAERGESKVLVTREGRQVATLYHRAFDPNNGDHLIALVLRPHAPAGGWQIEITGLDVVDGRWHAWIERNAACPRCQGKFHPGRMARTTTTGSICNAMRTIAVGAYDAHSRDRRLARFSSQGPTRDGRPKPLLVAPGVRILSVRSRTNPADPPSYVRMSGTSMAAPHVAGTAALMMQAAGRQPIAVLRRTLFAALEPAPGRERRWGYGLLDVARAVAAARNLHPPPRTDRSAALAHAAAPLPLLLPENMAMDDDSHEEFDFEPDGEAGEPERANPAARPAARTAGAAPWTKGHNQNVPTTQQRALAAMSESQLRTAVTAIRTLSGADAPGPLLVAMREGAESADPGVLIARASDPDDHGMTVVNWPGHRLNPDLRPGDLLVIRSTGGRPRATMIAAPALLDQRAAAAMGSAARLPGRYIAVIGERVAEQLAGPDGLLRGNTIILRASDGEDDGEAGVSRPVLREGARGPAVTELQMRLNGVHAQRVAAGGTGLDRAPLTVDGAFGGNTRRAVVAFQRSAFPSSPADWDGVVGSRTWGALLAAQTGDEDQAGRLPTRCPGLPERQDIDNFAFNSSRVEPRHQPQIVGIARCIIESQRSRTPIRRLRLIGHTDPVGSDAANLALGTRRAEAVRDEIRAAVRRMTGRATTVRFDIESRGEREPKPDAGASRRVEVVSDFAFNPVPVRPPASTATIEFVLDHDRNHSVDGRSPAATALMFGLWDEAYDAAGDVRNGAAETANFVGRDRRRFYLRVRDPAATGSTVAARWRTLNAAGANDDAPASQDVTLTETAAGSKIFVSRALMLVSDEIDARHPTHNGLTGAAGAVRRRGERDHRLRRARLDGSVAASYTPAGGGAAADVTLPVFQRRPTDVRRRLPVRVINYGGHATQAQIDAHFTRARARWAQAGLQIDQGATVDRPIPAGALDADGRYPGARDNAEEVIVMRDLIGTAPGIVTPDNTLTVVFVRMAVNLPPPRSPANAYATVFQRTRSALGDRFFIFIDPDVALGFETLGHEFHHVIFNRGDTPVDRQFFTFNTDAPALRDDPRAYRRIQTLAGTDPDNDPSNDAIINWVKRARTQRFQNAAGDLPNPLDPADATTGNTLTRNF